MGRDISLTRNVLTFLSLVVLAVVGHIVAYFVVHIPSQLEIVILIGLVLFYPIIRNPLIGLYAAFVVSPFIPFIRRLYYLAYERPSQDPLIVLTDMLLAFMLIGLYFEFRERGDRDSGMRSFVVVILLYFLYMLFRTFAFNISPASEAFLNFKYYGPPALFFLVGMVYAERLDVMKGLWTLTVVLGVVSCLYAFKQLYIGYSRSEHLWFASTSFTTLFIHGIARPFSFLQSPAAFADYAQLAVLGILMMVGWGTTRYRHMLLLLLPVMFYAVLITSVRSSWIGMFATFVLWVVVVRLKGAGPRLAAMAGLVVVYVVYQFVSDTMGAGGGLSSLAGALTSRASSEGYLDLLVTTRVSAVTNPFEEHSFVSRVALWKYLLVLSLDPRLAIMGRGVGTLRADSLYFTYLAEFGYPGFVFIIVFIAVLLVKGVKLIDTARNRDVMMLASGITVMNLIFAIIGISGTHMHAFPGDMYFWFWNGVLIKLATDSSLQEAGNIAHEDPRDT
jgi:hypothetical protein